MKSVDERNKTDLEKIYVKKRERENLECEKRKYIPMSTLCASLFEFGFEYIRNDR